MKKFLYTFSYLVAVFMLLSVTTLQAQVLSWDFESSTIGDTFNGIGWGAADVVAEVVDDPVTSGNNVMKNTIGNYNAAPYLMFVLPDGATLADYTSFTFKAYFESGDVGEKDIRVEAHDATPTGQFNNDAALIGFWHRTAGVSTAWEDITVDITNTSAFSDTIYLVFGIHNSASVWYADDVTLSAGSSPASLVTSWGAINRYGWPIIPSTEPGSAGMGGTGSTPAGAWATLRGEFPTLTATVSSAVVVTGQLEFVGGDPTSWSAIRYGLFRHDSAGTLYNAGTDSARYLRTLYPDTDSSSLVGYEAGFGYMFSPHSGTNDQVGGNGGNGTHWSVGGGSWISTFSGGTSTMGVVNQAPARADMTAGIYNWAISVQPLGDGTNEVRWYFVKEDDSYWFGGTVTDTAGATESFNGIIFGINSGNDITETGLTGLNVMNVNAELGEPIEVPTAPWQSYYVEDWGSINRHGWPIIKDTLSLVGDAGMGGTGSTPAGAWATLRGEFRGNVTPPLGQAIKVTGQLEFVGGDPTSWSAIRYGIFRHDSAGTLQYANTDSARWAREINAGTDSASLVGNETGFGYMFSPHSGTNDQVGGNGGNGTHWSVNGGSWLSSFSGGTSTMGVVNQAPARADMTAGIYNWAISVEPLGDGTNEVRWYFVKDDDSYWFGGTVIDTAGATESFNGIIFGINSGNDITETGLTGLNLMAVQVDIGEPIEVPVAPFQSFYVSDWGFIGGRINGWTLEAGEFIGDVSVSGSALTNYSAIRGEFDGPVALRADTSLVITGDIEFVGGGFEAFGSLRFGVFHSDSAGTLDSTAAGYEWSGSPYSSGYLFLPHHANNVVPQFNGVAGTAGAVVGGDWISTNSAGAIVLSDHTQRPAGAAGSAGTYHFDISITPLDGANEVRYYFHKDGYEFGGIVTDSAQVSTMFNSINFGINNSTTTGLTLTNVNVDLGPAIDVPEHVVGVKQPGLIPNQFALEQNYPNPFNPTTKIAFSVPQTSDVSLVVYDALGSMVTELVKGSYNPGYYEVNFNASNLASGVYFYRIKAGDFVSVKKLMLLK
ncbi:MAG: T9SS type A sorting domain-containing protein [Ignavibacteriaceae bacterium]